MKDLAPLILELGNAIMANTEARKERQETLKVGVLKKDGTFKNWTTVNTIKPNFAEGWCESLPPWHEARGAILVRDGENQKELGRTVWHNPGYTVYALTEGEYHSLGFYETQIEALEAL